MKDKIIDEVRKVRKEIESESKYDWIQIEKSFREMQNRHKSKLYSGTPKSLPARDVV